jgi:3-oxoacyl-[acyl-carrier-protein] synthase II
MNRVVITGMGGISPLGPAPDFLDALAAGRSATQFMDAWQDIPALRCRVAAPAELRGEREIPRLARRTMGRLAIFAAQSAQQAVKDAGLNLDQEDRHRIACLFGSTMGSATSLFELFRHLIPAWDVGELSATTFFQVLSNTAAINVAQYLGLLGTVLAPCSACSSAAQAIGAGYDLLRLGRQDVAVCGGAEDLHPSVVGSFDMMFATSAGFNDDPARTPRPFDAARDGLVCGEGGAVVLEERGRAIRRGARIYAEVIGYHTCTSGLHMSESNRDAIAHCIREALAQAGVDAGAVDYVNAHATGTRQGDQEEAAGLRAIFGDRVPVSSLKGHLGHTLAASAALEVIACLAMMRRGVLWPTRNLEQVAPDCEGLWHLREPLEKKAAIVVKNSFAFGGINACLVLAQAG